MNDMRYIDPTEWIQKFAVEVELVNPNEDFLKITETLTRIGIANYKAKELTQTCHLLHKSGKYYIAHFKELLALDGNAVDIVPDDILRRNRIIGLLVKWNMIRVIVPDLIQHQSIPTAFTIISHHDKAKWTLKAKYKIGQHQTK